MILDSAIHGLYWAALIVSPFIFAFGLATAIQQRSHRLLATVVATTSAIPWLNVFVTIIVIRLLSVDLSPAAGPINAIDYLNHVIKYVHNPFGVMGFAGVTALILACFLFLRVTSRPRSLLLGVARRCWRRPRWSMRAMFIGITIVCVVVGLVTQVVQRAEGQKRAIAAIRDVVGKRHFPFGRDGVIICNSYIHPDYAAGLRVEYDYQQGHPADMAKPPGPDWLRALIGVDYFADVVAITVYADLRDGDLRPLTHLNQLEGLSLTGCQSMTDTALMQLATLKRLRRLDVRGTKVTESGIADFQRALPNCEIKTDF